MSGTHPYSCEIDLRRRYGSGAAPVRRRCGSDLDAAVGSRAAGERLDGWMLETRRAPNAVSEVAR